MFETFCQQKTSTEEFFSRRFQKMWCLSHDRASRDRESPSSLFRSRQRHTAEQHRQLCGIQGDMR